VSLDQIIVEIYCATAGNKLKSAIHLYLICSRSAPASSVFVDGRNSWRRREGVEPSGNLTTPRLVLKTSGTTGHLPSPVVKSVTCYGRQELCDLQSRSVATVSSFMISMAKQRFANRLAPAVEIELSVCSFTGSPQTSLRHSSSIFWCEFPLPS